LHFVGDLHQPLHASDDQDEGGNTKKVTATGHKAGNLHHYWDTEFVQALGSDPAIASATLIAAITPAHVKAWAKGTPTKWAMEAFHLAQKEAYRPLPTPNSGVYTLSATYVSGAESAVREQLSRAGVRLATLLNAALP
jgi:S1/P1 Nuclease